MKFIGHCWRSKDEIVHKLVLWEPTHGKRSPGRPHLNYVDQLVEDTNLDKEHLMRVMEDRKEWRSMVHDWVRVRSTR